MSAFCQCLFRQNALNQELPKFFLAKVSSFMVLHKFEVHMYIYTGEDECYK